ALFGVGLGLGINMLSRFGGAKGFGPDNHALQQALAQQQNLIHAVGRYFPTSLWATRALQAGSPLFGLGGFLMFTVVAVVALVLLMYVAEKIFFGGLLGGEESRSSGKVLSRDELARETGRASSPLRALLWKEIRLLNRTPSFLMAALLPVVIMPVFAALPLLQDKEMLSHLPRVGRFASSPLVPVIALGVLLWMNAMSNVAATAISREGRHFWISRSLPVPPRTQVLAKLLHSMIFTSLNIVVVCAGLGYMGLLTPRNLAAVVVGGVLASIATASGGILVDLMRPHLTWTDPQQAMKGNLNVLFSLILILLMAGLLAGVTALAYIFARQMVLPVIILLFGVEAFVLFRMAGAVAERRYLEYED
ncbi:MAG TPA: hypothetical protein VK464_14040, partial [Symbiobacteriaceae bacterium]|nr:hypothetical protein [Symbiobacteriaceae bacterium]